jgi:CubicO group peptidase (beta-lactamase class C family)
MAAIIAWHGKTKDEHIALRDDAAQNGFRFLSLSLYGTVGSPLYAAVMIKRPTLVKQHDWPLMTSDEFQTVFNEQAKAGMGPVILTATGSSSNPRFAAVFQPFNTIPFTRHRLSSGDAGDTKTIQGMNAKARKEGLALHWAAAYGDSDNPMYCGIWLPVTESSLWNADGLADSGGQYQGRFDAQTSAWCRPRFVTLDANQRYLSVFTDREIASWTARHGITGDEYQTEFDKQKKAGLFPLCVQAAGASKSDARYAAIFAKTETQTAKMFTATGPVANAQIDAIIEAAMRDSPVKHAAIAITNGTRLVFARGYTFAEPDWPHAEPTTRFRMASVSKTVTAIAIEQLFDAGLLSLTDKIQDKLHLKTPSGQGPIDSRFGQIAVQQLLEHTSGLQPQMYASGHNVQAAFATAGKTINLPVTVDQTDAYIASLMLKTDPGPVEYNNCGYYLLGQLVQKLRGTATPADAYDKFIFKPLGISRIRRAVSLVTAQPPGEARYQSSTLALGTSDVTNDGRLVPLEYGTEQLEIFDGSGGLTGAVVDQARLIAALVTKNDTGMLPRKSVSRMLKAGALRTSLGAARAGYGFDAVSSLSSPTDSFMAQKGGSLATSNNVLSFSEPWGLIMAWASPPNAADPSWYPYYPTVMNIARNTSWGSGDLFQSQYGLSSL